MALRSTLLAVSFLVGMQTSQSYQRDKRMCQIIESAFNLNTDDDWSPVGKKNKIEEKTPFREPTNSKNVLGKSFFLPGVDLYSDRVGGTSVFDEIDPKCLLVYPKQRQTRQNLYYYENTQSFYNKLATTSNLKTTVTGKYTMGRTLKVKTNSISRGSTDVSGNTLRMWTHIETHVLDDGCYRLPGNPLSATVLNALRELPLSIGRPELKASWKLYENFLEKYGSHVVTKIHLGSSIRSWTFSKRTKNYSQRQFQVSACINFEGQADVGKLGVDACKGVTRDEIHEASHYKTSSNVNIQGGTNATRYKLKTKRTKHLIEKLMNEGRTNPSPVDYEYAVIWDIIKMQFSGTDHESKKMRAKAANIQQFYEGFQDFGCSQQIINGLRMRYFRETPGESSPLTPAYECWMEGKGCHSDKDCHVDGGVAYCYGNTCMVHKRPAFGNKAKYAVAQTSKSGNHDDGVNLSCYSTWLATAKCHLNYFQPYRIWPH